MRNCGRPKIMRSEYSSFRPDVIEYIKDNVLVNGGSILDPMAGTAPLIPYAEKTNTKALFNDINPVHYFINRAKCYDVGREILSRWESNEEIIPKSLNSLIKKIDSYKLQITNNWISTDVLNIFIDAWKKTDDYDNSQLSIFIKAIILLCIHPYSSFSRAKNQTWLKMGGMSTAGNIEHIISNSIERYINYYIFHYQDLNKPVTTNCILSCGDARSITEEMVYNTIFTSPAYPNRYDFTRLYAPEIYFLNKIYKKNDPTFNSIENLKTQALATNMVADYKTVYDDLELIEKQSQKTFAFLMIVKEKGLPKEYNYYLKYYTRYFINLFEIISDSLNRLIPSGSLYLCVQNNIHRGEIIALDEFIKDYISNKGHTLQSPFSRLRKHQGKRNISSEHPLVIKKHFEYIIRIIK